MADTINVLMCGGRRTGKTSIMSAMQRDMQSLFADGSIVLNMMDRSGELALYQRKQRRIFSTQNLDKLSYYDEMDATDQETNYPCKITLRGDYQSPIELNFKDIPGEWFVKPEFEEKILELITQSQILVIAVDSPHLVEEDGRFHDVYNRVTELTTAIIRSFQGNSLYRLILFVPLKCERYRDNGLRGDKKDMHYLIEAVKSGYRELLTYLSNSQKNQCTVAISPCITMGGLEFLQFVAPADADGNLLTDEKDAPLPAVSINPETGKLDMNWLSEYTYLFNESGDHFYKPEDCAQPLLRILLFFVAIGKLRIKNQDIISRLLGLLFRLPNQKVLDACKNDLLSKLKTEESEGYAVLNDPLGAMK